MRVIYKKPILEEIREAIAEAIADGEDIKKIILTKKEASDLKDECLGRFNAGVADAVWDCFTQQLTAYVNGVRVETE